MNLVKDKKVLKIILIVSIFFIDRISKILIINFFLIWNEGVAFGLLNFDDKLIYNLITMIIIFVSAILLYLGFKKDDLETYFYLMIFGGALGNIFDRLSYSAVPDFIDFHYGNYHWFIFNVADIFITLGVICLILVELFFNKRVHEKN